MMRVFRSTLYDDFIVFKDGDEVGWHVISETYAFHNISQTWISHAEEATAWEELI